MSAIMRSRNGVMVVSSRDRSRGRTALPSTKGYQEASGSATAPLSCGGAAPFNRAILRVSGDDAPSGGASSEVAIDACQTLEVAASRLALPRDALAGRDNSLNKAVDCRQCLFIIPLVDCPSLETF